MLTYASMAAEGSSRKSNSKTKKAIALKKLLSSFLLFCLAVQGAYAACGVTETCARINNLADRDLGTWSGSGEMNDTYTLCVYVQNDDESNYVVTGTGDGAGSAFELTNGTSNLALEAFFEEDSAPGVRQLTAATPDTFANPDTTDETCGGGASNSAKARVRATDVNLFNATAGTYTGNITLQVSPD